MKTKKIPEHGHVTDGAKAAIEAANNRAAVRLLRRAARRVVKYLNNIDGRMSSRIGIIAECQTALDDTQPAKLAGRK